MKRTILTLLSLVIVLSVFAIPASAGPPSPVAGTWYYLPYVKVLDDSGECVKPEEDDKRPPCQRSVGGNTFMETYEDGWWEGSFDGTSVDHGKVVIHRSDLWTFNALVYFEGEVNGASGTLVLSVNGSRPTSDAEWEGRWVILSGTGELETLHGQGNWWGPGWLSDHPDEPGVIPYNGKVHFAP
jgi:hypothetical protein